MNRKLLLLVPIVIALTIIFWKPSSSGDVQSYTVGDNSYNLLLADTPDEWEKGLMYQRELQKADGMIFIFPEKAVRSFWNKNTYMDLEVIWMSDAKIIGRSKLPSVEKSNKLITVISPPGVNKVVELVR